MKWLKLFIKSFIICLIISYIFYTERLLSYYREYTKSLRSYIERNEK